MNSKILKEIPTVILMMGLIIFLCLVVLRPIEDPDFWWHLKTGEYIVQNKSLPSEDPFSYTNAEVPEERERFVLKSYWFAQVVLYEVFTFGGFKGIILARAFVIITMFLVVFARMRRLRIDPFISLTILSLSVLSFAYFKPDRPQTLSFLFASVLIGLMESVREDKTPSLILFPLMTIWANVHGGFIVGDMFLVLFALGCLVQYRHDRRKMGKLLAWSLGGILASLVNPNTYHAFPITLTLQQQVLVQYVSEYANSFTAFFAWGHRQIACVWILVALILPGLIFYRQRFIPDILLVVFAGAISLLYVRHIAFFTVAFAPVTAFYLDRVIKSYYRIGFLRQVTGAAAIILVLSFFYFSSEELISVGSPLRAEVAGRFPQRAVEFIRQADIHGNMFNDYGWGGFLIWSLYPQHKVFIDTRGIDEMIFRQYMTISEGSRENLYGKPAFKAYLDGYGVNVVIQPIQQKTGQIQSLMVRLLESAEWFPVYLDERAYVAVRDIPENRQIIATYSIEKEVFTLRLLEMFSMLGEKYPDDPVYPIAQGELLGYMGRYGDAEGAFIRALNASPSNSVARYDLSVLRKYLER